MAGKLFRDFRRSLSPASPPLPPCCPQMQPAADALANLACNNERNRLAIAEAQRSHFGAVAPALLQPTPSSELGRQRRVPAASLRPKETSVVLRRSQTAPALTTQGARRNLIDTGGPREMNWPQTMKKSGSSPMADASQPGAIAAGSRQRSLVVTTAIPSLVCSAALHLGRRRAAAFARRVAHAPAAARRCLAVEALRTLSLSAREEGDDEGGIRSSTSSETEQPTLSGIIAKVGAQPQRVQAEAVGAAEAVAVEPVAVEPVAVEQVAVEPVAVEPVAAAKAEGTEAEGARGARSSGKSRRWLGGVVIGKRLSRPF